MDKKIASNLGLINENIRQVCESINRDSSEVSILPVTKTRSIDQVRILKELGFNCFGENLVSEAKKKFFNQEIDFKPEWIMIGHLQTNKVRFTAKYAQEVHSIDSYKLASLLDKELEKNGRQMKALIQINTSKEKSKYGYDLSNLIFELKKLSRLEHIVFEGFMTIAMNGENQHEIRSCFKLLREVQRVTNEASIFNMPLKRLSMGMSGDYKIAIEEGATELRLGQAIFGARDKPDSFYWPAE